MYDALSDGSATPERQRIISVEGQDLGVSFEQTVMRCVDISEITFSNEPSGSILFASNNKARSSSHKRIAYQKSTGVPNVRFARLG